MNTTIIKLTTKCLVVGVALVLPTSPWLTRFSFFQTLESSLDFKNSNFEYSHNPSYHRIIKYRTVFKTLSSLYIIVSQISPLFVIFFFPTLTRPPAFPRFLQQIYTAPLDFLILRPAQTNNRHLLFLLV